MFDNNNHMTMALFVTTVSEFTWPLPYQVEDDLPDGIVLSFPASKFEFCESLDHLLVYFLPANTKGHPGLHLGHALSVLVPDAQHGIEAVTPGLTNTELMPPSEERTKEDIRNACKIILAHLMSVVRGDFSWVDAYLKSMGTVH